MSSYILNVVGLFKPCCTSINKRQIKRGFETNYCKVNLGDVASDVIVFKNNQLDTSMCRATQTPVCLIRLAEVWELRCCLWLGIEFSLLQEDTSKVHPHDAPNLTPPKGKVQSLPLCVELETPRTDLVVGSLTGRGRNPLNWTKSRL